MSSANESANVGATRAPLAVPVEEYDPAADPPTKHMRMTYFPVEGRAEPVRFAFLFSGTTWEDERMLFPTWFGKLKIAVPCRMPLPFLPMLTLGPDAGEKFHNQKLMQTAAFAHYLCKKYNQYPTAEFCKTGVWGTALLQLKVDSLMAGIEGFSMMGLMPGARNEDKSLSQTFVDTVFAPFVAKLEATLKEHAGIAWGADVAGMQGLVFCLDGDRYSLVDFQLWAMMKFYVTEFMFAAGFTSGGHLTKEKYPFMFKVYDQMTNDARVKAYFAQRELNNAAVGESATGALNFLVESEQFGKSDTNLGEKLVADKHLKDAQALDAHVAGGGTLKMKLCHEPSKLYAMAPALLCAKVGGANVEVEEVALADGDERKADETALSPTGSLPTLTVELGEKDDSGKVRGYVAVGEKAIAKFIWRVSGGALLGPENADGMKDVNARYYAELRCEEALETWNEATDKVKNDKSADDSPEQEKFLTENLKPFYGAFEKMWKDACARTGGRALANGNAVAPETGGVGSAGDALTLPDLLVWNLARNLEGGTFGAAAAVKTALDKEMYPTLVAATVKVEGNAAVRDWKKAKGMPLAM